MGSCIPETNNVIFIFIFKINKLDLKTSLAVTFNGFSSWNNIKQKCVCGCVKQAIKV